MNSFFRCLLTVLTVFTLPVYCLGANAEAHTPCFSTQPLPAVSISTNIPRPSCEDYPKFDGLWSDYTSDFNIGQYCKTIEDAQKFYESIVDKYDISMGAEDQPHYTYYTYARLELMRIYYLTGQIAKGDAILNKISPLNGQIWEDESSMTDIGPGKTQELTD